MTEANGPTGPDWGKWGIGGAGGLALLGAAILATVEVMERQHERSSELVERRLETQREACDKSLDDCAAIVERLQAQLRENSQQFAEAFAKQQAGFQASLVEIARLCAGGPP